MMARASRAAKRARERVRGMSEGATRPSESAGEGVAVTGARQSLGRLDYTTTIHVRERIGPGGRGPISARVSHGRLSRTPITNV